MGRRSNTSSRGDLGKPFYRARSTLQTLALLEHLPGDSGPDGGSNSLRWWRRRESNPRQAVNRRVHKSDRTTPRSVMTGRKSDS